MNEVYEDAINYLKYYGEKNNRKIENIAYFLDCELKNYIKLQSNWNSLRECIIKRLDRYDRLVSKEEGIEIEILMWVRDKMNELEGKDKDGK